MFTHACEAATDLERHLEETGRAHVIVKAVFKSVFETVEMHRKFREFLFVGGKKSLLEFFELELLEPEDLVLMFSVPLPEGGFGDVDFESDAGKAPAVGAEGNEGGKFW